MMLRLLCALMWLTSARHGLLPMGQQGFCVLLITQLLLHSGLWKTTEVHYMLPTSLSSCVSLTRHTSCIAMRNSHFLHCIAATTHALQIWESVVTVVQGATGIHRHMTMQ